MNKLSILVLVCGLWSTPSFAEKVHASWYGPGFENKYTASGDIFIPSLMTVAHKTLPFGTRLKVSHEGKSVVVTVNDRGPFIKGRTLDLSEGAAEKLGCIEKGVCLVDMKVLD